MSSRVLKKLQGGADKALGLQNNGDDDVDQLSDDDDEHGGSDKGNHLNPFDLLNQQSFSESEVKEDDNETEHTSTAINLPAGPGAAKKRKKKRKKKTKYSKNPISSEDNELTDKYLSDIDPLIGKVCEVANQTAKFAKPKVEPYNSLMSVELRNLNPQNELRRTFGKRVVKVENKRGRQKLTLKSTHMVTAKESWPPVTKNIITMKPAPPPDAGSSGTLSKMPDGIQWFTFEHSQYYQGIQNLFLPAVERADSDFLINLIRRCPYHVDSLIQLSELCKMTDDYALGGELIERALLNLESSLHPSFSLTSGMCRLDYRRQENRAFFIVLFKQAQYLEARACCRTAFELAKLILSLNPETDPLAMVLILDYYALRSKQYAWLVKFYEEYDASRNLSQLPNMAYSYALALYCIHGECEKADKALQYALLMFPGAVRRLLEELSAQKDNRVFSSAYFNNEVYSGQSPALYQLIRLYMCRAKVVWRQNNILPWLERNVKSALECFERSEDIIKENTQKRSTRYTIPPRPILRHVFLSDYKEEVPLGMFTMHEKESIVAYDPLPPHNSINCYERKSSSSSPSTSSRNRPVTAFFQSLLPRFELTGGDNDAAGANAGGEERQRGGNAPGGGDNEVDRHLLALNQNLENAVAEGLPAGVEGGASYRELTQSLTNIVDAMRDFLQNFHISESVQPADAEENGSSEEDTTDFFD